MTLNRVYLLRTKCLVNEFWSELIRKRLRLWSQNSPQSGHLHLKPILTNPTGCDESIENKNIDEKC